MCCYPPVFLFPDALFTKTLDESSLLIFYKTILVFENISDKLSGVMFCDG